MRLSPDTFAMTATLALLTALGPLSTDMYLPSLPAIAAFFGTGPAEAQMTLSAFLFGFAAGQFLHGPLSDQYGRRPVLLAGLGLFIAATAACALAPSIEWLTVARFVQALGASGPIVLARAVVRDLYEGPRAGRELSRMGSIMGLVPALAPVLGGVLQALCGWRASFVVALAGGLALAAVVAAGLPETQRQRRPGSLSLVHIGREFGALAASRVYRVYVGLAALTYAGLFSFISGSSFVLQNLYGLGEVAFGLSFGTVVVGYICGTVLAQRLVGRRGLDGTIAIGTVCLAAGGLLMLALTLAGIVSAFAVVVPMAVYTFGVGLVMPQTTAAAMMPFPERAGAASSLLGICQMTFAALVGLHVGHVVATSAVPLTATIAAIGIAALALFVVSRRIRAGA